MEVVLRGMARAGADVWMAGFGGGSEDDTRGFGGGFRELRVRDGLCGDECGFPSRSWLALEDGDGAAARSGHGGFWARSRGWRSGLVGARGQGCIGTRG